MSISWKLYNKNLTNKVLKTKYFEYVAILKEFIEQDSYDFLHEFIPEFDQVSRHL